MPARLKSLPVRPFAFTVSFRGEADIRGRDESDANDPLRHYLHANNRRSAAGDVASSAWPQTSPKWSRRGGEASSARATTRLRARARNYSKARGAGGMNEAVEYLFASCFRAAF